MAHNLSRRGFLGVTAGAMTAGLASASDARKLKDVRVAVLGTGNRGTHLLNVLLQLPGVQITAVCDLFEEKVNNAAALVEKAGQKKPAIYCDGELAYKKTLERDDVDAVIIASYWQWHTPMALDAMKAGKYAGVEVPIAMEVEDCWKLVNTSEETGVPCMMMENWSFRRDNLAVLNMIRRGMLGEIVHCHCAHSHDCIDHWFFDKDGNDRWPADFLIKYNRDQYPTHSVGPVLSWLDINCGDAFESITSTATAQKGINAYFKRTFGKDHPNATKKFAQGDIVTSTIKTKLGKTLIVNYDMQLPRPYDNRWMIQGTLGIYNEQRNAVYLEGKSPKYHTWEPFPPYQGEYDHAWWKEHNAVGGHGGTDSLELAKFIDAVRNKTQTPIDVYDSVTMSCIVGLSGESIANGSAVTKVPDFTRGRWEKTTAKFAPDMTEKKDPYAAI